MIPLYAIGVFLSFTSSQLGMARRWWKVGHPFVSVVNDTQSTPPPQPEPQYLLKLGINSIGAIYTGVVTIVFGITNFAGGAWIVLALIPILVYAFSAVHRHYQNVARQLSLDHYHSPPNVARNRILLPIIGVHQGTLAGLHFARTLSQDITAVFISIDPQEAKKK